MSIKLVDFKDIQDAILEELKIQSSDTVSLARIKRVINEVYINEIIPFARWKWLEGHTKIKFREAYSAATASLTPNSVTVTLSTAPSAALGSFTGYYFASTSLSEIYIIESHTAGSTTITLSSQYLGGLDATASYKIWTDKIPLPTDCRETVTVWHNMYNRPMDAMGWQKLRELSLRSPKAEGYPRFYYTGDYKDPSTGTGELETDRYRELTVYPAIYSQPVTISVDYIKEVSDLSADGDEPVLPLEDRIVIKYGALKTLWRTIGRNPEEAVFSAQEYNEKLARMAGKIEDSQDKPQIHVDSIYMKRRRASRYRVGGYSSDMVGTGGSTTASTSFFQDVILQGGRISADFTVDTGITIDGVDISVLAADFAAHLADTADAHDASAISSIPSGNLAADDVQEALDELQTDIDTRATTTALTDHINDTTAAHAASAIAVTPTGNLAADDVQEALAELQSDVDTRLTASSTATLTNKTFDADGTGNSISNIENADIKAGAAIDASKIADGSVSNTEFQYISTVTSNVQTQLDGKVDESVATTKGDLFVATASATIARQGVGSDGLFLKADSAQTNGIVWASVAGSALAVTSKTTTYTATTSDDVILVDTSGGAWTLTLYAASGNSGKVLRVIKTTSDTNALNIDGNSSETINGFADIKLNYQFDEVTLVCDGTNWNIISQIKAPTITTYVSGSGTHTVQNGIKYLRVRMVGGGGGSSGGGSSGGGNGGTGGDSTFGNLTANGGSGGTWNSSGGAGGGTTVGAGFSGTGRAGQRGGGTQATTSGTAVIVGGYGGSSNWFSGTSPLAYNDNGVAGTTNTGAGGAGGGNNNTVNVNNGSGGGGGGFVDAVSSGAPSATYSYAVGSGGSAGSAGTGGNTGGAGAAGYIEVTEYYQ